MTWVIGRAGIFGYATAISDVRVTLHDGSTRDCLQKVYRLGRNLVLGFAGSIKIGLTVVEQLGALLGGRDARAMWDPLELVELLPAPTRYLFSSFPSDVRRGRCHLMLLGAHPTRNDGDARWARCYVHTLYSPEFAPAESRPTEIVSIGSGASLPLYTEALRKLMNDPEVFMLENMMAGGSALGHLDYISSAIVKHPQPGISPHLHVCLVSRNSVLIGTNDRRVQGHLEQDFVMPEVAHSWDELSRLVDDASGSLELATC